MFNWLTQNNKQTFERWISIAKLWRIKDGNKQTKKKSYQTKGNSSLFRVRDFGNLEMYFLPAREFYMKLKSQTNDENNLTAAETENAEKKYFVLLQWMDVGKKWIKKNCLSDQWPLVNRIKGSPFDRIMGNCISFCLFFYWKFMMNLTTCLHDVHKRTMRDRQKDIFLLFLHIERSFNAL